MALLTKPVNLLVEGYIDRVIVRRVLEHVGLPCGNIYGEQGKEYLLQRLPNYNQAAQFYPWLVVIDLDQDAQCAPEFVRRVLPKPAKHMQLRVAVRAIEAWLLADAQHLAAFLGISKARFPANPDAEPDPKITLVNLARQSHRRKIREDIVPRPGSKAQVGPGYPGRLTEFVLGVKQAWRPEVAMRHSPSLQTCVETLSSLKKSKIAP